MERTIQEAVDELEGLANEAEGLLEVGWGNQWCDEDNITGVVIHQLVELCAVALATCQDYEKRMVVAIHALQTGVSSAPSPTGEGLGPPEG